jgi:nucleoside-triphosphatase THEP1
MIDYFRLTRTGFSGIVTKPVIEKNIKTGHYLEELENGREHLLCTVSPEPGWISSGRFYFNPETLKFGNDLLASFTNRQLPTADCQLPTANRQLIIIDELGPLELKGSGWWPGIASLLKSSIQKLIIVVREEIMVEAWNLLKDHHVHIININDSLSPEEIARRVLWEPV